MKNSKDYYNNLSESYDSETIKRLKYLNKVDDYIIQNCKDNLINNYLDVGSGDGRRSMKIADKVNVNNTIYLIDNSESMSSNIKENDRVKVYNISVNDLETELKFDLITCLWNVLGHFPNKESVIRFFKKVDTFLSKEGIFVFDVNNRYNIAQYGNKNVAKNIEKDILKEKRSGWFTLGKVPNQTQVYIHSPFDINFYLQSTNLYIDETLFIDYNNGSEVSTFFEGQLLYKLKKRTI